MFCVPQNLTPSVMRIIEWHLETYMPEKMFNTRLERILTCFYKQNLVEGMVQLEEDSLWYLDECVSNATNNILECGVEESIVWQIYHWVRDERKKAKK